MQHTGKNESKKEIWKNEKKKKRRRSTRNLLEKDSNPDPQNQLELRVDASTNSVNAVNSSLRQVYIPSLCWLAVFQDDFRNFFNFRLELNL